MEDVEKLPKERRLSIQAQIVAERAVIESAERNAGEQGLKALRDIARQRAQLDERESWILRCRKDDERARIIAHHAARMAQFEKQLRESKNADKINRHRSTVRKFQELLAQLPEEQRERFLRGEFNEFQSGGEV